jgi:hypothetical protein
MRFIEQKYYARNKVVGGMYELDPGSITSQDVRDVRYGDICEVVVGSTTSQILGGAARQIVDFSRKRRRYRWQRHDCVSFAYACLNGQLPSRRPATFSYTYTETIPCGPATLPGYEPGSVWLTIDSPDTSQGFGTQDTMHFMVGASAAGSGEFYASKLGANGPLVLHSFAKSLEFYPAQTIEKITSITL